MTNEIISFVERNSFQEFEGDIDSKELAFTTRENGDVGEEKYSEIDFADAEQISIKVLGEFNDLIESINIDTCDEWVNLVITLR